MTEKVNWVKEKMITKQDEILVTLHNEFDKKVGKKVFERISDARNFAEMALKHTQKSSLIEYWT